METYQHKKIVTNQPTKVCFVDYDLIFAYMNRRNMNNTQLAKRVGMSATGLKKALDKKTLTVETLERIAKCFEVNIIEFFPDYQNIKPEQQTLAKEPKPEYLNEIALLKQSVKDKEEIINLLKKQLITQ